jgi:hypothetical protein
MGHSFSINWGKVLANENFPAGWQVYALWPAPVNEDECFAAAGFTHFKYDDENWSEAHWDGSAEILQQRLLRLFLDFGEPVVLSVPLLAKRSALKFWQSGEKLPLAEQLRWPILNDSLPPVVIRFGNVAELRAGYGIELYWIALSPDCAMSFEHLLTQVASGWPVACVQLDWSQLG